MKRFKKLEILLKSKDINESVIQLDEFICKISKYGDDLGILTEHQKIFFLNQTLERDINNGGFNQYFINSSGDDAHETILSLKAIGAKKTAAILQKAIDQFPGKKVPKDRTKRIKLVEKIEDKANKVWDKLNQKFYEYEDDLNVLNMGYVAKNKDFF